MCNFLSGIVLKNGDALIHPLLDSHADLVRYFKLPDTNAHIRHFVKVELTPVDWTDVSTWQWRVDEDARPAWWSNVAEQAEATLRARAAKMILTKGEHDLIVDGCWIVAGTAKVRNVRSGRILRVRDSAQIFNVGGSAQIFNVGDSAQISDVGGSAQISGVWDSTQISDVGGSAQISGVWGSAQIFNVWGSAQISDVGDAAVLDDSAKAHVVRVAKP